MFDFEGVFAQQSIPVGGESVAPTVVSVTPTIVTTGTSHAVSLGATVASGDLLIIWAASDGALNRDPSTTAADWSKIASFGNGTAISIFKKLADGTEGGTTIDITTSATEYLATQCFRISTWSGNISDIAVGVGEQLTFTTTIPVPSLTSGFGSVPTLWICGAATSSTGVPVSAPANYTLTATGTGGTANSQLGTGYRQLTAPSETPGNFVWTTASTGGYGSNLIAIKGI